MNFILIGMRGSGKTTVAKLLAKKLHKKLYDLDILLTKKVGLSIPEIINKHGWDFFRNKETEIAKKFLYITNAVIATGGGVILKDENMVALGENSKIIYLKTTVTELLKRIGDDKNRPALTNEKTLKAEMEKIFNGRKNLYENYADIIVETDNKTPENIVKEILKQL